MQPFNYKKATQALNFFALREGGKIDKLKAIKLIWLADRLHLRKYYRTITGDVYYAMPYGPVASHTLDLINGKVLGQSKEEVAYFDLYLSKRDKNQLRSTKIMEDSVFSKTDMQSIAAVYEAFGDYSGGKLSDVSHKYPEWTRFEKELTSKVTNRQKMDYLDFFRNPESRKNDALFEQPEELLLLSRDFYLGE